MIIDSHVHIGTWNLFHLQADADFLLSWADKAGFDKLFVTETNALSYNMTEGNEALAKELAKHSDRLIGYVTAPSPRLGRRAVDEIKRCHERYGMRGLKLYSHPEASIAEPETYPLLEAAAQYGMPVLAHITPAEADHLMTHVPEVYLMMAHMGGHPYAFGDWHRAVAAAKKHKNLLCETASSQIDNGMIEYAVAEIGAEKIIFGTDMPLLDPFAQVAKIRAAAISEKAKAMILGGNMARILEVTK